MPERNVIGYQRLFEVRLLHHYWLDEGKIIFDTLPADKRDKRLLTYDRRPFLAVAPTTTTETMLKGLGALFKNTALGWLVAVPKATPVSNDTVFEFILTVQDADFFNYTALTLPERKIDELYYQPEDVLYRYKANVPVLSNLTGGSRGTGANKLLFLSKEIPVLKADDPVESLVLSGAKLLQLTSDQPGANTQEIAAQATDLPIYVHQDDAPTLVPPAGLTGVPKRGVRLSGDIPNDVFAIVRIAAVRPGGPGDADFSCTSGGLPKSNHPVFQVRFKNRSTRWEYFDKNTRVLVLPAPSEPNPRPTLPLTRFGNASIRLDPATGQLVGKQKPSEGLVKIEKSGTVITRLVSEIYI